MRRIRMQAAQSVADQLTLAEAAIDDALAKVAGLTGAMALARIEANLPPMCAEGAFSKVQVVSALLFETRSAILDTHRELAIAQTDIGLREVAFGDLMGCPPIKSDTDSNVVAIAG
jgi:hypothetical protein